MAENTPTFATASTSITESVKESTGFDFGIVISLLLPMLMNLPCFKQENVPPAEFLNARYNPNRGTYRPMVLRMARGEAEKAAEEAGDTDRSHKHLNVIAKAALDKARTDPDTAKALWQATL